MHLLITGCGFLGFTVAELMLRDGYGIHFVVKRPNTRLIYLLETFPNQVTFSESNPDSLVHIFKKREFGAVLHLATNYGRSASFEFSSVLDVCHDNLAFPCQILKLANRAGVPLFINTDSYFNKEGLQFPRLIDYALTKKSFLLWLDNHDLDIITCTLRLEHVYGLFDRPEKFVSQAISQIALSQSRSFKASSGFQTRDFVNSRDVANAFKCVIESKSKEKLKSQIFEVGFGSGKSIREFLNLIREISSSRTLIEFGSVPLRSNEIFNSAANLIKMNELGWKPEISIQQGVSEIVKRAKDGESWLF